MDQSENKLFLEHLKKVSPGTALRTVIDDLLRAGLGALIVFDSPGLNEVIEGGFKVNCRFSPQKLFELCKMDGAIVVSPDLKKILHCNVLLAPSNEIETNETGTRHKAAERTAKHADTFVVAVSERKRKTTLYFSDVKHYLKNAGELLNSIESNLHILEKNREIYNELLNKLNILENSNLVSVKEVCEFVQRTETIMKIAEVLKRSFTEIGKEGNVINLRFKELMRDIEKTQEHILRDYSQLSLKKSKKVLENFSFEDLLDIEKIALSLIGKPLEINTSPRGFRFLDYLDLDEKDVSLIVNQFKNLDNLFNAKPEDLEKVLRNRGEQLKAEIESLKDQVLSSRTSY